nr:hypothetical protein [uncultured Desulfobacter sp.]
MKHFSDVAPPTNQQSITVKQNKDSEEFRSNAKKIYTKGTQAKRIMKNLPCKMGGTIDKCLTKKASIPAVEDLGWVTSPLSDGSFEVERLLLLNKKMPLKYKWHVDKYGNVKAINGKAIGITK